MTGARVEARQLRAGALDARRLLWLLCQENKQHNLLCMCFTETSTPRQTSLLLLTRRVL
jgi:hypothetical protein